MNKNELALSIAEKTDWSKATAEKFIDAFTEIVGDVLADGDKIQLTGFGTFETRTRNGRQARNPKTGERIWIEPSTTAAFKAGKVLKEIVNG